MRIRELRPHCEACTGVKGRATIDIDHPAGEEVQWDWDELPETPWGDDGHLLMTHSRGADDNAVHLFAAGVMVPEAVEAARALNAERIFASVFVVTSPDRLYRGLRDPRPYLEELITAEEEGVPVVSVQDGHSHGLAFLGSALGVPQQALGVDGFGQSGSRRDLYAHYGIDAPSMARAAKTLLGRVR